MYETAVTDSAAETAIVHVPRTISAEMQEALDAAMVEPIRSILVMPEAGEEIADFQTTLILGALPMGCLPRYEPDAYVRNYRIGKRGQPPVETE